MGRKRVSRNAPCPCGSGKKYKRCCYDKGFVYEEDDEGAVSRAVPISPEMAEFLEEQRQAFIEKFGREPGPNDRVFFDMPAEQEIVEDMKKVGIEPAIIYAFQKTGRLVFEDNRHLIPDVDLAAWDAAIKEYQESPERN